jgi:hypothetical protein
VTDSGNAGAIAWAEYTIIQSPQWFNPVAHQVTRCDIVGLTKIAGNDANSQVFTLNAATGEVTLKRAGRFIICGSTYVQGSIQNGNPNYTIDVMGALIMRIPPLPVPDPGIRTHELRIGQSVVPLSPAGNLQDSGFSFCGCTTLMLPPGTKISLRVGVFADNLTQGQFVKWQTRNDSAVNGVHLSIHEIAGGL